jgi:excisionase family DNA binding protein
VGDLYSADGKRAGSGQSVSRLTLDEAAALLKLPADPVRASAEEGDLPGRRLGNEWRFARSAVLAWLADGEPNKRNRNR